MIDGIGVQRTTFLEAGIAVAKQLRKGVSQRPLEKGNGPVQRERPGRGLEGPAKATFNQTLEAMAGAVEVPKFFF